MNSTGSTVPIKCRWWRPNFFLERGALPRALQQDRFIHDLLSRAPVRRPFAHAFKISDIGCLIWMQRSFRTERTESGKPQPARCDTFDKRTHRDLHGGSGGGGGTSPLRKSDAFVAGPFSERSAGFHLRCIPRELIKTREALPDRPFTQVPLACFDVPPVAEWVGPVVKERGSKCPYRVLRDSGSQR